MKTTAITLLAAAAIAAAFHFGNNQPGELHKAATGRQAAIEEAMNLVP